MSVTAPYVTYGNQNMATSATVRVNTERMGAGRVREYVEGQHGNVNVWRVPY